MKGLFLKAEGKPSVIGWILLMVVATIPTMALAEALDLPTWLDWSVSILWIIAVIYGARRVLGVRF